jgi:hypothetical protein
MRILLPLIATWLVFVVADENSKSPPPPNPLDQPPEPSFQYAPAPTNPIGFIPLAAWIPRVFIDPSCIEEKRHILEQAWYQAALLVVAQTGNKTWVNYNQAHTFYLGTEWNSTTGLRTRYRTKHIGDNLRRLNTLLFDVEKPFENEFIYWYCEDDESKCGTGQVSGKTSNGREGFSFSKNSHSTIWCPEFWHLYSLEQVMSSDNLKGNPDTEYMIMENFETDNLGVAMLHEIWKYDDLVSNPRMKDVEYIQEGRSEQMWSLARKDGTKLAYVTADSYIMDALAIYVQQRFNTTVPPVPSMVLAGRLPTYVSVEVPPPIYSDIFLSDQSSTQMPTATASWTTLAAEKTKTSQ